MDTNEKRSSRKPAGNTGRTRSGRTTASQRRTKPAQRRTPRQNTAPPEKPAAAAKKTAETRPAARKSNRTPPKRRRPAQPQPSRDVVYTQPDPFNRGRFILNLLIVGAVVLALIFGMSIFFKVDLDKVTISGTNKYSAMQILEASGIKDGENLLSISEPRIASKLHDALPYVDDVRVGIKLPDTVKIEIVELEVVYAIESVDAGWWLMRSDGVIIEKTNDADAGQHTKILGIKITTPAQGQKATAAEEVVDTPDDAETVPVTVKGQEQLSTAISILQLLEDNGIVGDAASVDVTNLSDLQLWFGERFNVLLGDVIELSYKVRAMKSAIDQMGDYQGGVLDVSFTTWPNEVGYTPFS